MRRELTWGMSSRPIETTSARLNFDINVMSLGNIILESMDLIKLVVLSCFEHIYPSPSLESEKVAVFTAQTRLTISSECTRNELSKFCDELDIQQRTSNGNIRFPQDTFDVCLFMISLLQVSAVVYKYNILLQIL